MGPQVGRHAGEEGAASCPAWTGRPLGAGGRAHGIPTPSNSWTAETIIAIPLVRVYKSLKRNGEKLNKIQFLSGIVHMGDKSAIEWTDATWNPVTGCTKITRGCDHCYAERFAERFRGIPGHPFEGGFDLRLRPERLSQPLTWKKPRMIFVNSMSDLFHKKIPTAFIDQVFETMEAADRHIFQVLTKRSSLMRDYLRRRYGPNRAPQHIWCGVSVEDQTTTARIRHLQQALALVRFLSIEPLLGPMGDLNLDGIDWVIVGGESGPKARPMQPEWVIEVRDQCEREGVPFFFKQWGGRTAKSGGRLLEEVEYNAMPAYLKAEKSHAFQLAP